MAVIAVLSATHPRSDLPAHPRAGLQAGGVSLLVRALRQVQLAGAERAFVLTDPGSGIGAPPVPSQWRGMTVTAVTRALDLSTHVDDGDQVLLVEEGVLVDQRLVMAVRASPGRNALAVWPASSRCGVRASRIDSANSFASVLKASGHMLRAVAKGLGDWDLEQTLIRQVAAQVDTELVLAEGIDVQSAGDHRAAPLLWQPVSAAADEAVIADDLVAAAQEHGRDWPSRFVHPLLATSVLRLLVPTGATPNLIVGGVSGLGLLATTLFAAGWPGPALASAMIFGVMAGLPATLADVRTDHGRWPQSAHLIYKIIEFSWYLALAFWLSGSTHGPGPWALAVLIIVATLSTDFLHETYRRLTASSLDESGQPERRGRLLGSGRNTNVWMLLPFAVAQIWYAGLAVLAIYGCLTLFWAQFRFFIRLGEFGSGVSPQIRSNLEKTAKPVLPWRKS